LSVRIQRQMPFYLLPDIFRSNNLFIGDNCRDAVNDGRGDFIPIFFSEIPLLFERGLKKVDVALVTVSPPDNHGYCTLSVSVDVSLAAVQTAKHVIGQLQLTFTVKL